MSGMTPKDYEELIELLDGRIDELTKPIPSKQILRFAEAIRSAKLGDEDSVGTFNKEDYGNLLQAQLIVNKALRSGKGVRSQIGILDKRAWASATPLG